MHRSYLFAPGHHAKLLRRVFEAGADAVILDLEDAVPPDAKQRARAMVADVLADQPAWVRINTVRTDLAAADLDAVAGLAAGIRIPKAESADDVQWVADRAPGVPVICAVENARGLLAAPEIATVPGVRHLSMGGVDLRRDLSAGDGNLQTLYARSHIVARPASGRRSTASIRASATTAVCASRPSSPARSASSANPRSTRGNSAPSTTCSRHRRMS